MVIVVWCSDDILRFTFQFLTARELCALGGLNGVWNSTVDREHVWRQCFALSDRYYNPRDCRYLLRHTGGGNTKRWKQHMRKSALVMRRASLHPRPFRTRYLQRIWCLGVGMNNESVGLEFE